MRTAEPPERLSLGMAPYSFKTTGSVSRAGGGGVQAARENSKLFERPLRLQARRTRDEDQQQVFIISNGMSVQSLKFVFEPQPQSRFERPD